ncbi:MAG: S-layer homology domain-containing protein [Candidatus Pacebacteria bacterium]|nr:S-layer homology domain-containing protein [Candidatus Paceibacterota bacterium]
MNSTLDDFSDGAVDSWQAKVVNKAADLGFITTANSTFNVNQTISRVEALKIVMRAGILTPLATPTTSSFADVPAGSWESKYTEAALMYNIIAGNTNFRPADAILRGESSKLIMNTLH